MYCAREESLLEFRLTFVNAPSSLRLFRDENLIIEDLTFSIESLSKLETRFYPWDDRDRMIINEVDEFRGDATIISFEGEK